MQVHRLGDKVAIHINDGPTVYVDKDKASEISDAIVSVVDDIEINASFSESQCGTWND